MAFDLGSLGNMAGQAKELSSLSAMWSDVEGKNWPDLYERIETAKVHNEADPQQLDTVKSAAKQAEQNGKEFPHSLPKLTQILHEHMPH